MDFVTSMVRRTGPGKISNEKVNCKAFTKLSVCTKWTTMATLHFAGLNFNFSGDVNLSVGSQIYTCNILNWTKSKNYSLLLALFSLCVRVCMRASDVRVYQDLLKVTFHDDLSMNKNEASRNNWYQRQRLILFNKLECIVYLLSVVSRFLST